MGKGNKKNARILILKCGLRGNRDEEKINYELIEKYHFDYFLTRDETFKKRYLLKEIELISHTINSIDKKN